MKKNYPTKTQLFCIVLASFALLSSVPYLMGPGLNNPQPIGKFLNGKFPSNTPQPTPYRVAFPNLTFNSPLTFLPLPGGERIVVGQRDGKIYWFDNDESTQQKTLLVDLSAEVGVVWDGGFLGLTAHPEFGNGKNYFYMYYSSEDSQSRDFPNYYTTQSCNSQEYWGNFLFLKRIEVNPTTLNVVPGSLSTLIKVRMYGTTHRGGGLLFGNDGFLYLTTGDQTAFRKSQDIFNNLDGGVLRIDVDKDPSKSHAPIRTMPEDHGYSDELTGRGYYIPNDNPFLSPGGQRFEEYYTLGHRNPHRMSKDKVTGTMYIGEIGGGRHEEINVVKKGKNFGWPLYEGYANGPGCGLSMYNNMAHEGPLVAFPRSQANAIIGGFVYRGTENPDLYGKYICADYGSGEEIWKVDTATGAYELITNFAPNNIISFGEDLDGELYLLKQGNNTPLYKMAPGLQNGGSVPLLLSETNAFSNLQTLQPSSGLLPYELIEPFWSDGAKKKRWMAIPNNGTHNTAAERIVFSEDDVWQFPSGTVLVKHFELPIDERDPSLVKRLETRFSIKGNDGNFYFLTYKWNDEGTDAVLLTLGLDEELSVTTASGGSQTVTWTYPDKGDCVSCHNSVSQGTLGLRTRYLNSDYTYPTTGNTGNQLVTLSHLGILDQNISDADTQGYLTYKVMNNPSASLDEKARSYLDLNCAYCHRPGTGNRAQFDLRMLKSLDETRLLTVGTLQPLGISGEAIVKAGDASKSILYHRMNSTDAIAMPPIAKNRVDVQSVSLIEQWINGLDTNPTINLAWNKPAIQSSTGWGGLAEKAVDGDRNGVHGAGSVTHTTQSTNPWWRVDLGDTYALSEIKIYNRTDCCTARLQDAKVYVGTTESNDPNQYTEIGTLGSSYEQIFNDLDVMGRYVMVHLAGSSKILSLAEVEVYGALNPVVPVTGVAVSPSEVTLVEGDAQQLVATVSPNNATNTDVNWSSNDTDVATVDANGEVTAVSVGQAIITATTDDGGFTAQTNVSVTDATGCGSPTGPPSATVSVDDAACGTTTGGFTFDFVDHPDRTHIEFSTDGGQTYPTYVRDNIGSTSVAGLDLGDYNVWVRWGNNECPLELGDFTIAEDCVPVTGVTVSPVDATLTEGDAQQLTATIMPGNASNRGVSWSSSDTGVATVDANGLVTAISEGSATITVTTDDGDFTATSTITVEAATVPVTGVTVSPEDVTLTAGGAQQLTATVSPGDATNRGVSWSSSDTDVATVDANGLVTAVSDGSATIT
ncbi:MAG: Ig-like domain-containing protein, partial [Flavobacteriaceae bacterium]